MTTVAYQLPLPPSTNNLWKQFVKGGRAVRVRAPEYIRWTREAGFLLQLQGVVTPDPPVAVAIAVEGGKGFTRQRDLDNFSKATLDLLKDAGVIADDNLCNVVELRLTFRRVPGASRCVVTVASVVEEPNRAD